MLSLLDCVSAFVGNDVSDIAVASQALQKLVGNDKVKCVAAKRDVYQRVLGVCFDARTGVELNKEMINEGEAIAVRS
jgi:endonuclease YncB( thermonuclease family)